jgi:hypothetical protein
MVPPTINDWNRLEDWLWRTERLRELLESNQQVSPFRPAPATDSAVASLPKEIGSDLRRECESVSRKPGLPATTESERP